MWTLNRLIPAALISASTLAVTPACASQVYGYHGYDTREMERRAYDNGYRDGVRAGEHDGRDGRVFAMERQREWRDADDGYHRDYGDREFYQRNFREGFRVGYSEGFNRYARGGVSSGYPSTYPAPPVVVPRATYGTPAAQNGYRDGLEQGRDDARDHDRFDPTGAKRYREGDHDYHDRYGSREEYKREYRAAFQQGYDEGYRTARR